MAANVHDTQAAGQLLDRAAEAGWAPVRVKADRIYTGARMDEAAARHGVEVQVSAREGFQPLPLRWRIEATFDAPAPPDPPLGANPSGGRGQHQYRRLPQAHAVLPEAPIQIPIVKQPLKG
jgi:hypothetical protein